MQTVEILKAGRALISDPIHWNRGWYALDSVGREVGSKDPNACSWCSLGALNKLGYSKEAELHLEQAIRQLHPDLPLRHKSLDVFNDHHTHTEVLQVWDKAIENANR